MTLDQIGKLIDSWEAQWSAPSRPWRQAKVALVTMVLKAVGQDITEDAVPIAEARKVYPGLTDFLEKWDDAFAAHRLEFCVDIVNLLTENSAALYRTIIQKLGERAPKPSPSDG